MIDKTVAILAGGKSSRMNYNNKALLKLKEETFIEHIIKACSDYKEIIIVANNENDYKKFGLKIIPDIYKNHGPMGGIHSALVNSKNESVLCIACDMPLVKKEVINYIGEYSEENKKYNIVIPEFNESIEPLCAVYSKALIKELEENLKKDNNKLRYFILNSNHKIIKKTDKRSFSKKDFLNINTPLEFDKIKEF